MVLIVDERYDEGAGQRLLSPESVMLRITDHPAGSGMTDSGIWLEHKETLPAIFGDVLAAGSVARAAGIRVGAYVLFIRYSLEITDELPGGTKFAIGNYDDLIAEIPRELLVFAGKGSAPTDTDLEGP